MTYKKEIRPIYPNKYNTKQKTTFHILIPKYNTPNNRMIYKYEIRPPYPTKGNIQHKTTSQTTQPIPKSKYNIHIQNKNHRKYHHTLHIKYPSHPSNSKYLQLHQKTNLQTKHRKHLKQIPHPSTKIRPINTPFSYPKHGKPISITKRYKSQPIPNKLPFSTPNYHSNYEKYQKKNWPRPTGLAIKLKLKITLHNIGEPTQIQANIQNYNPYLNN
jgi:hypothetical protein